MKWTTEGGKRKGRGSLSPAGTFKRCRVPLFILNTVGTLLSSYTADASWTLWRFVIGGWSERWTFLADIVAMPHTQRVRFGNDDNRRLSKRFIGHPREINFSTPLKYSLSLLNQGRMKSATKQTIQLSASAFVVSTASFFCFFFPFFTLLTPLVSVRHK